VGWGLKGELLVEGKYRGGKTSCEGGCLLEIRVSTAGSKTTRNQPITPATNKKATRKGIKLTNT